MTNISQIHVSAPGCHPRGCLEGLRSKCPTSSYSLVILYTKPNCCTIFLSMFISFLYMFQATMCPSSGETYVFMRHLVLGILYGWMSGMQGGIKEFHSTLYTRQPSIQNTKYQVSHKYSCFYWWWAYSRPKHVEKRNKYTKKNCTRSWLYLQDYTRMHGQLNIKNIKKLIQFCFIKYIYWLMYEIWGLEL